MLAISEPERCQRVMQISTWQKLKLMWHLWVDTIFYPEATQLRAFLQLKKRKDLVVRCISTLGKGLKTFHLQLGLSAASREKALCILTSHKVSV